MLKQYFSLYRRLWFALLCMLSMSLPAQAVDYSANIEKNGSVVTLWFKSNVNTSWVNAHYNVNNGAQQNVPMSFNSAKSRFETNVNATTGQTVNYSFTYDNAGPAYDTPWASSVVIDANKVAAPTFSLPGGNYASSQQVSVSSATAGATLLCTINGGAQAVCANPITISQNTSISAIATKSGMTNSDTSSVSYTIGQISGPYTQSVQDNTSSATIIFTPNPSSAWVDIHFNANGTGQQNMRMQSVNGRWEQPIAISGALSLSYSFTYMTANGAVDTPSFTWTRSSKVATPVITPNGGSFVNSQLVTLSTATSGASMYYTLDGSTPTANSNLYVAGGFTLASSAQLRVIAMKSGVPNSDIASASFTIQPKVAMPIVTPNPGTYASAQTLSFISPTSGASLCVTVDGSTPVKNVNCVPGSITVSAASTTVKAIAYKTGMLDSDVLVAQYQIQCCAASPSISPNGGTFSSAQTVSLSSATVGATLYYTTDGSTPSSASLKYSAPFTVAAPGATVKAIAVKSGLSNSSVASASFTISACSDCFAQGVVEDGATAKLWFAPSWAGGANLSTAIAHYKVTSKSGAQSPQRDENMSYNATLKRWEAPTINPVASGDTVSYFFTYSAPTGGNKDSALFQHLICGDGPSCPDLVGKPVFSLPAGKYSTAQSLSLSLPSGVSSDAKIYYTVDGSIPSTNSLLYVPNSPISISKAVTINAITVLPNQLQSRRATASYDIVAACSLSAQGCPVAAPSFSHASGSYNTVIGINLLTQTTGATVHYTTDGTTPTASSPQFYGAIWLRNTPLGNTTTIKAIATKNGVNSPVVERTYTITANNESTWNGLTTFNIVNGTQGEYSDDQVYWTIIGIDWVSRQYVHVDKNGNLIPMSLADNTIPVPNRPTGYANYSISLAQAKSVTIPPIESARIYMSVGKPVLIQVNINDLGKIAYAGPDLNNTTDPNLDVTFDFGEFNINRPRPQSDMPGIFVNTSRVDIFGFPLKLNVKGLDGYDATVGESLLETREELFARYMLEVPEQFKSLAQAPYAPYRIMSPAHATFDDGLDVHTGTQARPRGANADYLDAYISQVWDKYRQQDLVMNLQNGWPTFTGRVGADNVLTFTDSQGSYKIRGKPSTTEVMLGNGLLDDATGTLNNKLAHDKQLQLQAQVCAALNRHVAEEPFERWWNGAYFYPAGQAANYFTKFWHEHSLNGLAYGFSYDDVGGHSPSIYTPSPTSVTFTIGK